MPNAFASVSALPNPVPSAAGLDAALIQRFNAGDELAFNEIVLRHRPLVLGAALRHLHNHADAEEIVQDTFMRAYRSLKKFRGDSSLGTWLYRISSNLSLNRYWYFFRRRQHLTTSLDMAARVGNSTTYAELIASPEPDPVREIAGREFSALVSACMTELPRDQRQILELRNFAHLPYSAIATALGIKFGTVKSRVARARESLRILLQRAYAIDRADDPHAWFERPRASAWALAA